MGFIKSLHDGAEGLARLPVLAGVAQRQALAEFKANKDQNLFHGVYPTWAEAEARAAAYGAMGYDNTASAQLYVHRMRLDTYDYPSLYWIGRSVAEGMSSVFDVGGSIGIKYYAFLEPLSRTPVARWFVQDVPAVVDYGRQFARERSAQERLQFTSEFADGDGIDLLFASGVVQYLPETLGALLSRYRRLPKRIVVNTAAIHPVHEFFTVNSTGVAFCPYRVQTQGTFIRGLTTLGYRMRESWVNTGKKLTIPHKPEYSLSDYTGFCLDLAT
jgi:putative methyltransferase (TIGR04325 family)